MDKQLIWTTVQYIALTSASLLLMAQVNPDTGGEVVDRVLDVSPYNSLAYGLLVLVSWIMTWVLYKKLKDSEEYNRDRDKEVLEFNKEMLQLMVKIELRLSDQNVTIKGIDRFVLKADDALLRLENHMKKLEEDAAE